MTGAPRYRFRLATILLIALSLPLGAIAAPPPGLDNWWPADGNADDVVGLNHGTLHGGASFATGRIGQSFDLSGTTDYVSAGHTPFARGDDFSIALWTRLDATPTDQAFAIETRMNQVLGWAVTIWTDDRYVIAGRCDNASTGFNAITEAATVPGQWHHVGVVFDWQADEMRVHVDGCLDTVRDLSACDGFTSTDKFFMGASSDLSVPFNLEGRLDEVQLYTRALTSAEVASVFGEAGTPASCAPAVPAAGALSRLLLIGALGLLGALALDGHGKRKLRFGASDDETSGRLPTG